MSSKEDKKHSVGGKQGQMLLEEGATRENKKLIKAKEIARKLKSIDHFVFVWGQKGKYYLPPKSVITWHYVSQILCREKRLLKISDVGHTMEVPKVRGAVVNELFQQIKHINNMDLYFPDFTDCQNVPRDYFFNVSLSRF